MDKASTKEYKVGDKIWWHHGDLFIRCTVTRVDDQWVKKHPEGILFYEIDEPTGHSIDADELAETLEEAIGEPEDWEEVEVHGDSEPTLDAFRRKSVRFILSTHLDGPAYMKEDRVSDEEVQKAIADWGYPPKKRGEDWLTFEEALGKIKKK